MSNGRHLENDKLLYLSNWLTDFDEILHSDILVLQTTRNVRIFKFSKIMMADVRHFKKR